MKALLNILKLTVVMTVAYFLSNYLLFEKTVDERIKVHSIQSAELGGNVLLIVSPGCSACIATESYLNTKKINYNNVDVKTNSELRDELVEMNVTKVPVLVFNGRYIEGYNSKLYKRLLESSNANS